MPSTNAEGLYEWGCSTCPKTGGVRVGVVIELVLRIVSYLAGVFIDPLFMLQSAGGYFFTFYRQGGGDVVIIQTLGGVYITGDLIGEDMDDAAFALLSQNSAKS